MYTIYEFHNLNIEFHSVDYSDVEYNFNPASNWSVLIISELVEYGATQHVLFLQKRDTFGFGLPKAGNTRFNKLAAFRFTEIYRQSRETLTELPKCCLLCEVDYESIPSFSILRCSP